MAQNLQKKWEVKVSTTLNKATADQIWPLFKDFFNIHKWFPGLPTCYGVHGTNGVPGCIRFNGGTMDLSSGASSKIDNRPDTWARERLISLDENQRSLNYEVIEGNFGFTSYVGTFKVLPRDDADNQNGCVIEWSVSFDPVDGWQIDDFVTQYGRWVQGLGKNMEDACT